MDFILSKLRITPPTTEARDTLIGVCMAHLGSGLTLASGSINLYFFSYFYSQDNSFEIKKASMLSGIAMLLLGIIAVFSLVIATKIGFSRHAKIFGIVYISSIFISAQATTFEWFALFNLMISSSSFALLALPNLNCLWSHFDKAQSGRISGLAFFCQSISTILCITIFTAVINPDNESPTLIIREGEQEVKLFDEAIASRFSMSLTIVNFFQALMLVPGVFKISKKEKTQLNPIPNEDISDGSSQIQKSEKIMEFQRFKISEDDEPEEEDDDAETNAESVSQQNQRKKDADGTSAIIQITAPHPDQAQEAQVFYPTMKQGIKSAPFILIYSATILHSMLIAFLAMNFRVYSSTKISDDYYITFVMITGQLIGSLSSLSFGQLIDKICFKKCLLATQIGLFVIGVSLPQIASSKMLLLVWYIAVQIISNGVQTITGPIFIRIFGLDTGSHLLPIKATAFFIGLILVQGLNYLVFTYLNYDIVITFLGFNLLLGILLLSRLKTKYVWEQPKVSKQ